LNEPTVPHGVVFPDLLHKVVLATFDQPHASSDGGAPLLKAADRRLGLVAALTATFDKEAPVSSRGDPATRHRAGPKRRPSNILAEPQASILERFEPREDRRVRAPQRD
jgi:hypothetical protein